MGVLIHQWTTTSATYRLVRTSAPEAKTVAWSLEQQMLDSIGDRYWKAVHNMNSDQDDRALLITGIIAMVLQEPKLDSAYRMGGWEAVHAIIKPRFEAKREPDNG